MFSIRNRYLFIFLLSLYSYINIRVTVGERLFDFELNPFYLFGVLALVVLGVWELNRLVEKKIIKSNERVHPLILLFLASVINVVIVSTISLFALYAVLDMPLRSFL